MSCLVVLLQRGETPLAVFLVCCVVTSPCEASQHHPGILTLEGEETLVTQRKTNLFPLGSKTDTSRRSSKLETKMHRVRFASLPVTECTELRNLFSVTGAQLLLYLDPLVRAFSSSSVSKASLCVRLCWSCKGYFWWL